MAEYNYEEYTQSLEKILESAQRDYWAQYVDINRHQVNVGRTYLWVSAALIGAYTAGYQKFINAFDNPIILSIFLIAFSLSVVAFGLCLYAIPARKGYQSVHKNGWGEFSHIAYQLLSEKKENLYTVFLTDFISRFDVAHNYSLKTNLRRARLLRATSWLLIISFSFAVIGLVVSSSGYNDTSLKKEKVMIESEDTTENTGPGNQPSSTDKPNVPVPPPPAGTQSEQIHTHDNAPQRVTRVTEAVEHKSEK